MPLSAWAKPKMEVLRTPDLNLFNQGDMVSFKCKVEGFESGQALLQLKVSDFFGKSYEKEIPVELTAEKEGDSRRFYEFELGAYQNGYYELDLSLEQSGQSASASNSFGVVVFNDRTREEVLEGDYRFGMKMYGPRPFFDGFKALEMAARLGLHWTRDRFDKNPEELNQLPVKIIYKVEGFPKEAYDEERYGPIDEFKLRHFGWNKGTLPLEEPYKEWLAKVVAELSEDHYVFEIWNEAWGKLPEEDFAKVTRWSAEVINKIRPDAVVGPNLGTHSKYDAEFIKYGGMEGSNAVIMHPYGHPEESRLRGRIRGVREFYERALGRPIELYATEYGTGTPPGAEMPGFTEKGVAALNVRRSLVFYVEDLKGFMPHTLGQSEQDPKDKEDWYGHFRRNMEPKPALIALATAARLIDGANYIGDIFYKPDVGAYLFEREGEYILALWTNDNSQNIMEPNPISVEIQTGVDELKKIDIVGGESMLQTQGGMLQLDLNGNMIYLVGVSPKLEQIAYTQPRSDQWVRGVDQRTARVAHKMKQAPVLDGRVTQPEWGDYELLDINFGKHDPKDISGTGYVAWDDDWLYAAVDVVDDQPMEQEALPENYHWRRKIRNPTPRINVDSLNVYVGTQPQYQIPNFLFTHDRHFVFAPKGEDGEPVQYDADPASSQLNEIPGAQSAFAKTERGWSAEIAIPLSVFKAFPREKDATIAFEMSIVDMDKGKIREPKIIRAMDSHPGYFDDATVWSLLKLVD